MTSPRGGTRTTGRATSVDVAREAGVSQATVARVFAQPAKVAPATRARVEAAADQLGYVPNAIARSLKKQRTDIVGAVVPAYGEYWQHVVSDFSRQLAARHKQLLLFSFPEGGDIDDVLSSVRQFRVDGVILASANITPAQLARAVGGGVPVVAFNQPSAVGVAPSVSVDNEGGMRMLARHLIEIGVETVQFVGGVQTVSTDRLRYLGAAQELGERGIACPYVEAGAFSYDAGYKTAQQLGEDGQPDAYVVAGDELALGLIDGLATRDVRVPDDVLVVGFDGLPQAGWSGYDLTTLVQPTEELVERALDQLLAGTTGGEHVVIEGHLRIGRSTTPAQPASETIPDPGSRKEPIHDA